MPWKVLIEASGSNDLPVGRFWRVNFSRVNWDFELDRGRYGRKRDGDGKFLPEYNWVWSPQGVINMHEPEHWGYAYFSPELVGTPDSFSIPKDEQIKWLLYKLYRAQKDHFRKEGQYAGQIGSLGVDLILADGSKVPMDLESHRAGWSIRAQSPYTGQWFQIREDGRTETIEKVENQ